MANASVEKLKALGLRHGEKAVVGLSAAVCFVLIWIAATKESIALTPAELQSSALAAQSNINKHQDPADILKQLDDLGIKNPSFAKVVEDQEKNKLLAANFKCPYPWVTFEPGAGVIRDMPELIAPSELYAYPGRGGALIYALNDQGERIPDEGQKTDEATTTRRKKRSSRMSAMAGMMAMNSGGSSGMSGSGSMSRSKKGAGSKEDEEKTRAEEEKKIKGRLVGKDEDKTKDEPEEKADKVASKEITKGLRWVAVTGLLDHKKLVENYTTALKNPSAANPHYKRLDVERQQMQTDKTWSEWKPLDTAANYKILDNLPEEDEELTPETVRLEGLVDPLPFLKAGYWERVHIASLVPKEKKEVKAAPSAAGGMESMMSSMTAPGIGAAGGSGSMNSASMGSAMQQQAMMARGSGMSSMGSMEGMGGSAATEDTTFAKTDADTIMVRALDFTVESDATYRFRARIVVVNPNKDREDISPGVDTKTTELTGPWSEPTDEVTMPSDVAAYVLRKTPSAGLKGDLVQFQVTKWNPDDGVTVVHNFDAGPGEIIGNPNVQTDIPTSDGSGLKHKGIDYNSRDIVLDTMGDTRRLPSIGTIGSRFEIPVVALLVRPDGSVLVRSQYNDVQDEVRKDIAGNYEREKKESGKKRENSIGSGYGGSSSMMQMMGFPGSSGGGAGPR